MTDKNNGTDLEAQPEPEPVNGDTCGTCLYFTEEPLDPRQGIGQKMTTCYRYPPTPIAIPVQGPGGQMGIQITPVVPAIPPGRVACGEYEPREDPEA